MSFISLNDNDISDIKINTEYIPKIDAFIHTLNTLKNTILIPEQKEKHLFHFKRIIDIIEIANNPEYSKVLTGVYTSIERNRKMHELRNHVEMSQECNDDDNDNDEGKDIETDSEDEFKKDDVSTLLKKTYDDIKSKSTLQQKISLVRTYMYQMSNTKQTSPCS